MQAIRLLTQISKSANTTPRPSFSSFSLFPRPLNAPQNTLTITTSFPQWNRTFSSTNFADTLTLANLRDNAGARTKKIRVGRGTGGGRGKTSGKGHKGQKARSGGGSPAIGFEGGQTPLYKRMRKYGFTNNQFKVEYQIVNLDRLPYYFEKGRLDASKKITMKDLLDAGVFSKIEHGVKLLGGTESWKLPINIEVSSVSKSAEEAIKNAGGSVTTTYYTRLGLRHLLKPEKFERAPKRTEGLWSKNKLKDGRYNDWNPKMPEPSKKSQMSKSSSGSSNSSPSS